jgi:glycosyltransferase involved in cell wall biosynthesis
MVHPKLSLCLIVKNEAANLPRCLESVQDAVDEIVVVDTGSTDASVTLAESYGARVLHFTWQNDFALARNFSLDAAAGDWLLVLDADEALPPATRRHLRSLLATPEAEAVEFGVRNFQPAGSLLDYEDGLRSTRLFRNQPEYRYEQSIHEQILPAIQRHGGRVLRSPLHLDHYGYAQRHVQGQEQRAQRNLRLLQQAVQASPNDPYLHYQLGITYKSLNNAAEAEQHLRRALLLDAANLGDHVLNIIHMKLAQLALAANRPGLARKHAHASLARNPRNLVSLYVAALSHAAQQEWSEAYPYFQEIVQAPEISQEGRQDVEAVLAHCEQFLSKSSALPCA